MDEYPEFWIGAMAFGAVPVLFLLYLWLKVYAKMHGIPLE